VQVEPAQRQQASCLARHPARSFGQIRVTLGTLCRPSNGRRCSAGSRSTPRSAKIARITRTDWPSPTATAPAHVRRARGDHSPPTASAMPTGAPIVCCAVEYAKMATRRGHCASSRGFGIGACQHAEPECRGVPQRQVQGRSQNQADVLVLASRFERQGLLAQ
jgi:hypothetical protein